MNTIELVEKYLPILDEQYRAESRSAILDVPAEFVQDTKDAKKVKLAKIRSDKLGNYSRHSGFAEGYADLTWEEHEFTQDRGRAIQIDVMDNQETFGLAFGKLAGNFQKEAVIPEIDAYRFATYYKHAGTKKEMTITAYAILNVIDDLDAQFDNDEVPENDRLLFVNPQVFKLMINDPSLTRHISVLDSEDKTVNKKIYMYDNHVIVKVPQKRFYTAIEQLDGKTAGQEAGGYVKAAGAKEIGMLMVQRDAVVQLAKRAIARIWAPSRDLAAGTDGVNPYADAWKFDYRLYHDAWALDEKISGIAGVIVNSTNAYDVNMLVGVYEDSTFKPGEGLSGEMFGTTLNIYGEIPYESADATLGLGAGNRIAIKYVNSAIHNKEALPTGVIVKILRSTGEFGEYDKDAFESDGSLIQVSNVNNLRVGVVKVTWFTGEEVTYCYNTNGATLEAAE